MDQNLPHSAAVRGSTADASAFANPIKWLRGRFEALMAMPDPVEAGDGVPHSGMSRRDFMQMMGHALAAASHLPRPGSMAGLADSLMALEPDLSVDAVKGIIYQVVPGLSMLPFDQSSGVYGAHGAMGVFTPREYQMMQHVYQDLVEALSKLPNDQVVLEAGYVEMMRDLAIENFNTPSSAEEIRKQLHAPNRMLGVLSDWDLLQPVNAPRIIGLCEEALGYVSQHLVSEERAEAIDKASRVLKQHNGLSFKKQVDDVNGELCYLIRGEGARLIADSLEGMPGVLLSRMAGMVMAQPTDAQGFAVLDGLYGLAGQVEKPHAR